MRQTKIHGNKCTNQTRHEIVAEHRQDFEDPFWGYSKLLQGQILRCCGCDNLSFRLLEHAFEFEEDKKIEEQIHPIREYKKRKKKFFTISIPTKIENLYKQTIEAQDNALHLLSAIGLRCLLEAIVVDRFSPTEYSASIQSKIDALKKHFSQKVVDLLHELRFMGNKAAHEIEEPNGLDIHRALYVIEDIMTFFYGVEDSVWKYNTMKNIEETRAKKSRTKKTKP